MEQESRAQIGKELSKIYFDRLHSGFNQQNILMQFLVKFL